MADIFEFVAFEPVNLLYDLSFCASYVNSNNNKQILFKIVYLKSSNFQSSINN